MSTEHLDHLHRASPSTDNRDALDTHRADCRVCQFEHDLSRDLSAVTADADALDRLVDGALDALTAAPAAPLAPVLPLRPKRLPWILAAAAALLTLGALAAAVVARRPAPTPAPRPAPTPAPIAAPAPVEPPSPAPPPAPVLTVTPVPALAPAPVAVPAADALYRRANEARHAHRDRDAVRLYDQLLRAHPTSREAVQARVALATLLVDAAPARAAALFEEHLRAHPGSPDEEAAMVGRARALQHLGRRADERRQWEHLLARHPDSLHAATARARLDAP